MNNLANLFNFGLYMFVFIMIVVVVIGFLWAKYGR
jgi:hypothetical protein